MMMLLVNYVIKYFPRLVKREHPIYFYGFVRFMNIAMVFT